MIRVSNLSYSYNKATTIRFPDFNIERGEHCLLLGESGSGKTTLLHLMGGLLRGYAGNLQIDNTELSSLSELALDKFRGKKVGFIFQKNHLIQALNVERNLLLAPYLANIHPDKDRIEKVLFTLGLTEKRKSKIAELSHGQAQRVAIGRAILNYPPIILADEPTSALDDRNCERVINLLLEVTELNSATLIIATHDQRLKSKFSRQVQLATNNIILT